ncbi:hypothetical protein LIER_06130 [Lithospermum erythrorhizon]|uniref:Uncharacterized protein n=1 Tax=Lithospermum erythrorhizon TaxID=34254 RepID=A0AAV3P3E3_LITER
MLYAFHGTCKDVDDENRSTLSSDGDIRRKKITGKSKVEDTESSCITQRNYCSRCTIFASSNLGPNGHKFVVVPTHCLDRTKSSIYPEINTEDLDMIASFSAGSLKFRELMTIRRSITDGDCSGESIIIARSHTRPQFLHLPNVKYFINDGSKWKVLPFSSLCKSPSISIEYPLGLSCQPGTVSTAYRYYNGVDNYKAVQRNSKRKASSRRGKCNDFSRTHSASAELDSQNDTPQTEDDKTKVLYTFSISMPYMRETVSRINQNTTATDPERQQFVECTFMVDTSENGLIHDGNDSLSNSAVTYPDIYKSLLPGLPSPASDGGETCSVQHHEKLSNEDTPHGDVESSIQTFRNNCVIQAIDRDRTPCALEKKEYQSKKVPRNSSVRRHNSLGNLNLHYGKENTHSIWKKVEKKVDDGHSYKTDMQSTNVCTFVQSHHKHHSVPNSCFLSKSEDANMTQLKASKKTKRRNGVGSKQDLHSTCIMKSHCIKGCSCGCSSSIDMKKTKLSGSRQNLAGCESRSFPRKNFSAIFQAKKVESIPYKSLQKPEAVNPEVPSQSPDSVDPVMVFHVTERQCELPPRQISFPDVPNVHKDDSFVDDNIMTVKELPATNYCKEKMCSAVMAEKCVNVGVNNFSEFNLGQCGSQLESLKLADESLPLKDIKGQKSFCSSHFPPYPVELDHSLAIMSGDEIIKKSEFMGACTQKINCNNTAANGISCELKNPVLVSSASDMVNVFQAANDAYRVQLASEAIQSITGSPIAEFEKFMYSASPVLYGARDTNNCKECSPLHAFGAPLCEHETPNLALRNIWRWYEKHGTCGMEVRATDHEHSVRLGMDQFEFRAYFVPYLSAVQLFRKCKEHTNDADVCSQETDSNECSLTVGLTSILRKLVPQPCSVNSSTPKMSQIPHKEASLVSMNNKINNKQYDLKLTDGVELLFEYFEYDQPQQRRPLFEMMKELSNGDIPLKSRVYGDPRTLDSRCLDDLHCNSWYSVAWYPIYRIPDGKLRAAFLTYHSLGHLVRRSKNHGSDSMEVSIVSPVVGLQCYSAQGECWFNPRKPIAHKMNGVIHADSSHVLKERIRTLERTASVMARATVTAGSQTYVNRQPDYEFFLSRRR